MTDEFIEDLIRTLEAGLSETASLTEELEDRAEALEPDDPTHEIAAIDGGGDEYRFPYEGTEIERNIGGHAFYVTHPDQSGKYAKEVKEVPADE